MTSNDIHKQKENIKCKTPPKEKFVRAMKTKKAE